MVLSKIARLFKPSAGESRNHICQRVYHAIHATSLEPMTLAGRRTLKVLRSSMFLNKATVLSKLAILRLNSTPHRIRDQRPRRGARLMSGRRCRFKLRKECIRKLDMTLRCQIVTHVGGVCHRRAFFPITRTKMWCKNPVPAYFRVLVTSAETLRRKRSQAPCSQTLPPLAWLTSATQFMFFVGHAGSGAQPEVSIRLPTP